MTTSNRNKIIYMSAVGIAKEIKKGNITCIEVVETFINHINKYNSLINGLAYECFDDARHVAKQYDIRYKKIRDKNDFDNLPQFFGLPIIIKESFEFKGKPLTYGMVSRRNIRAKYTCKICKQLINNGMIILGASNLSESCLWIETINKIYGITSNPYDIKRTVGGSSGGSAALVAISAIPMSLASDSLGSIRLPSYYNGVFGHKVTGGILPYYTHNIIDSKCMDGDYYYSQGGPITKYATDLQPLLYAMFDNNKKETIKIKNIDVTNLDFKDLNIIYIGDSYKNNLTHSLNYEIKNSINDILTFFKEKGSNVSSKTYDELSQSFYIYTNFLIMDNSITRFYKNDFKKNLKNLLFGNITKYTFGALAINNYLKKKISKKELQNVRHIKEKLKKDMKKDLEKKYTVFISPTFPIVAPIHNKSYKYSYDIGMLAIFNILGFPVTQVPLKLNTDGVPLGMQIIGDHYMDNLTMKVAEMLEKEGKSVWISPKIIK